MGTKERISQHGGSSQHEDGFETEDERGHRYHGERRRNREYARNFNVRDGDHETARSRRQREHVRNKRNHHERIHHRDH